MVSFDWHYPKAAPKGRRFAFDIETNGLLPDVNKLHSLVLIDLDSGVTTSCAWHRASGQNYDGHYSIEHGLKLLSEASLLIAHNGLSYDVPVLKHLVPGWDTKATIRDTLVLSKMLWPTDKLKDLDFPRWRGGKLPGNLIGAHKLEAWGYRLGQMKGEYSATVKEWSKKLTSGEITEADVPSDLRVLLTTNDRGQLCLDPWLAWNKPMQDYCEQDVRVTVELFKLIESHLTGSSKAAHGIGWSPRSVALEHDVWLHCDDQQARGFGYDLEGGIKLAATLKNRQGELARKLIDVFGSWWQPLDDPDTGTRPARDYSKAVIELPEIRVEKVSEKTGKPLKPYIGPPKAHYTVDAPFVKIERVTFNPKSRRHLGDRLQAVFGWQPTEWVGKDEDQAKVDETTIREMENSVLPEDIKDMILEFLVVSKTLGQLADGRKSWNSLCGEDGRLHGRVDPLGTVSHRGAHKDPNLGQVPSVTVKETKDETGKVVASEPVYGHRGGFGAECRSLFLPGRKTRLGAKGFPCQTGTDASGLELRLLGHYLYPYDDGAFATRVSTPGLDIHAENAKITGLTRAETKTTTYAFLYGAGNLKIGLGVGVKEDEIPALASSPAATNYVRWMKKLLKEKFVPLDQRTLALVARGGEVSKAFLEGITGLKDLKQAVTKEGEQYGFIHALDGRKLYIRKAHASLNQLLQGGGAIVCKMWMVETDLILQEQGLKPDVDYGQMAWVHDELQFEHQDGLQAIIAEASKEAMRRVGQMLDFRGELTTDSKHGTNWKTCH